MKVRNFVVIIIGLCLVVPAVHALNPDDELWIAAAGRGKGAGSAFWVTDLYILNLGEETVMVEIAWLARGQDNTEAEGELFEISASETLVLEDVVLEVFGFNKAWGGIHVEIVEDDEGKSTAKQDEGNKPVLAVNGRVYSAGDDGETFGLGFEGVPSNAAISADGPETTHSVGVTDDADYRSNWYGVNISEDEAEVMVELLDLDGTVLASDEFTMEPFAPILQPVGDLEGPAFANGTLRFTMIEGEGIFGVTKIDERSNDAVNLESHWECGDGEDKEFTSEFFTDDCTFATTGRNPFWIPLVPGYEALLEGDEDGEEVSVEITVLEDTFVVDGVETRVVQEYETIDGELVEISRNYFAFCMETGSIFYFGEDVDIYEDGEIVSHDGAWLSGVDGAEAGIIMPGTVLLGSRYFQEVAPGVALDRAEHVAMDVTAETEAGTFEDCLEAWETTPLAPDDLSIKVYAPGVGLVIDDVTELVEYTDPGDL
jgi:hypothetical protein